MVVSPDSASWEGSVDNKGAHLNERVWRLFERAGFETKPSSHDAVEETVDIGQGKHRTIDLSAIVKKLEVKVIGENTTDLKLNESFSTYVHDLEQVIKAAKADAGLWTSTTISPSAEDRRYAEKRGIRIWGEDHLRYYEAVADAIGEYAKYEILHSFGIETAEEKNIHNVLAIRFSQPYADSPVNLFLFSINPDKLLKTCVIYRRAQGNADAYQRMLRKDRLRSVQKFVTGPAALLPPNIIVHFGKNVRWEPLITPRAGSDGRLITLSKEKDYELVLLSIPLAYTSLELIDGQHRLYGFVGAKEAIRETFNLVVLGIEGLNPEQRRDTFVAINDKMRRMDPNLVAYLKYTADESECREDNELMAIKIVVELNKTTPFADKIRLLDIGDQKLTLKGFSGYDLKGLLGKRGFLRKHYPHDSAEYIRALRLYFSILKSLFPGQWQHPETYIIFTNSGVSAFLKLLKSILNTCKCPLSEAIVRKYLQPLRNKYQDSDWETKTLAQTLRTTFIGSSGWKDLHRLLVATIREVHPDFENDPPL